MAATNSLFTRSDEPLEEDEELWTVETDPEFGEIVILQESALVKMSSGDVDSWMRHWHDRGFLSVRVDGVGTSKWFHFKAPEQPVKSIGFDDPMTKAVQRGVLEEALASMKPSKNRSDHEFGRAIDL